MCFNHVYMCTVCVSVCVAEVAEDHWILGTGVKAVMSHLMWVDRTKFRTSAIAAYVLNC